MKLNSAKHSYLSDSLNLKRVVFSGFLLAIAIILGVVERWISWPPFTIMRLKFDLSLLALLPIFWHAGVTHGLIATFASAFFRLVWRSSIVGVIAVLTFNLLFTLVNYYLLRFIFKLSAQSDKRQSIIKFTLSFLLTSIVVILVMTVLQGLLFTPWLFNYDGRVQSISYSATINAYENGPADVDLTFFLWGIKNYWSAIFATHVSFNVIRMAIIAIILIPSWIAISGSAQKIFKSAIYQDIKNNNVTNEIAQ